MRIVTGMGHKRRASCQHDKPKTPNNSPKMVTALRINNIYANATVLCGFVPLTVIFIFYA